MNYVSVLILIFGYFCDFWVLNRGVLSSIHKVLVWRVAVLLLYESVCRISRVFHRLTNSPTSLCRVYSSSLLTFSVRILSSVVVEILIANSSIKASNWIGLVGALSRSSIPHSAHGLNALHLCLRSFVLRLIVPSSWLFGRNGRISGWRSWLLESSRSKSWASLHIVVGPFGCCTLLALKWCTVPHQITSLFEVVLLLAMPVLEHHNLSSSELGSEGLWLGASSFI